MGLFFSELALELQSDDKELVHLTLIKLSRISPSVIEDVQSFYLINRILRQMSLSKNQDLADLASLVRDRLDQHFSFRSSLKHEKYIECIEVLQSELSTSAQTYEAIINSSEYEKIEDLNLYVNFLKHNDPLIRCAALEVYLYHARAEDLTNVINLVNDTNSRVRRFAIRVLNRFGERKVINCLQKMMNSNDEESKISAIHCLANLKTTSEIVSILKNCSLPGSERVRSEAIMALGRHYCSETIAQLKYLQKDLSIQICELARSTLNNLEPSSNNGIQIRK